MTHHFFRSVRSLRGQAITIARKPQIDRQAREAARRAANACSHLPQHRRRGHRRSALR